MRIIVFWGLYWGPLILGNYHIDSSKNLGCPIYRPNVVQFAYQAPQKGPTIFVNPHRGLVQSYPNRIFRRNLHEFLGVVKGIPMLRTSILQSRFAAIAWSRCPNQQLRSFRVSCKKLSKEKQRLEFKMIPVKSLRGPLSPKPLMVPMLKAIGAALVLRSMFF